jgi:Xaa-Pro aminopeptidase
MISRIGKLNEIKKSQQVDAFFISSPSSVKYFSGYFFYFEYGSSPFQLVPAILMVVPEKDARLVLADNELGQMPFIDPALEVQTYETYTFEKPPDPAGDCVKKLVEFILENKLTASRIGIERNALPFSIAQMLRERFPLMEWINVSAALTRLKSIKDADEIDCIRQAARLADIGQATVLKFARDGMSELELFSLAHRNMETETGSRLPLMADLSSGSRTASGGGMPTNNIIRTGDLLLSDFTPCLNGYWGDSCNTIVVGSSPTAAQKKTFVRVREALEIGIQAMKPGVRADTIDRLMRDHIGNYPHHSGHGVGTMYHESLRIVPYNDAVLEKDMVIALEPAIYENDYGIRLEHLMLVTSSDAEVLTGFQHCFEQ